MLNVMRDNLRHLKWVLVVVALALLGYLGAYFDPSESPDVPSGWAATIDDETITAQEFLRVARTQDDYYSRLLGGQYDQMKKSLRLGTQSIQSLIDRRLILAEARALGLRATKAQISEAIVSNPSFKDPSTGSFVGKERYTEFVSQNFEDGVAGYERGLAEDILAQKWMDVMTASARISDAELEQAWRARNVRGAVDFVFVPASPSMDESVDPATLSAWYASHSADYKRPEARKIRMLVVDRQSQVAKAKVTDAEVKADYDAHAAQYTRGEQRHVRHILYKLLPGASPTEKEASRALAAKALARAQSGEDFAALARSESQDPVSAPQGGDLGWFGRGAMVKPFDEAAFSTPPGQFAPVVETEYGFHVIRVEDARAAGTTPFEEVQDSIRRRLELQRAQDLASTEAQRIAAAVKKPADLDDAAAKSGLKVEERIIAPGDQYGDLGPSPEFLSAVGAMAVGQVSGPHQVATGLAIVGCTEILPAATRPFEEVRDRVKGDLLNDRSRQAALVTARRIAAAGSLADGAKASKLEVKQSGDLTAGNGLPEVGSVPELDAILFNASTTVGAKGALVTPGGAIAYEVTKHGAFDPAKFETEKAALRGELLRQRREQLTRGIMENLRQKHEIEINTPLIESVNG